MQLHHGGNKTVYTARVTPSSSKRLLVADRWTDRPTDHPTNTPSSGKNRRLSSIFDSCWRNEVSNFRIRKFAQVGPVCEPNRPDVDINNISSLDNSGSNETMQKVLASIVQLWRIFPKDLGGQEFQKLEIWNFCVFLPI